MAYVEGMSDAIARVEALLARAAHPGTPEEEARTSAVIAAREIKKKGFTVRPGTTEDGWRERTIQELRRAANLIRDLKEQLAAAEQRAADAERRAGSKEHHGAERPGYRTEPNTEPRRPVGTPPHRPRNKRPINY